MDELSNLGAPCQLLVGFLFKRRCGRITRVGCPYCKGVEPDPNTDFWNPDKDPYFTDHLIYPDFRAYDWFRPTQMLPVDFVEADGATLLNDDDDFYDFENEFEAS